MNALREDLLNFAHAIIRGEALSPKINSSYSEYSATTAIEVYRNNYRGNLIDALSATYPVVEQLVGKDFFRQMAKKYIAQHPSRTGNLHHYGEQLATFIATFEPVRQLVYLADVAKLEWACNSAYFCVDADPLEIAELADVSPEQYVDLILPTHPSCHLLHSQYPIVPIWQAHQPGASEDFHIDLEHGQHCALVIRQSDAVHVYELPADFAEWLINIQSGMTLGQATDNTLEQFPKFAVQTSLATLIARGVFIKYLLKELK